MDAPIIVVKQWLKNFDKSPGWFPLLVAITAALELAQVVPRDVTVAGRTVPMSTEIVAGVLTLLLYQIGDAIDELVFKTSTPEGPKTRSRYLARYCISQGDAQKLLGIEDGVYDVSLGLANASEKIRTTLWIHFFNEWAKFLRALIVPLIGVAGWCVGKGRFGWAVVALAGAGGLTWIYPLLKTTHIRRLYKTIPTLMGAEYKRRNLADLRMFFWKGTLVGSAVAVPAGQLTVKALSVSRDAVAPDGSDVRLLSAIAGGSMAHFELASGRTSVAVQHRTVEEIWYFIQGTGEMWRQTGDQERIDRVKKGVSLTLPLGTRFQFRSDGVEPLAAIGVTIPPWPGDGEAFPVSGRWTPSPSTIPGGDCGVESV